MESIKRQQSQLLEVWRTLKIAKISPFVEKLMVLKGRHNINSKILSMIGTAKEEILVVSDIRTLNQLKPEFIISTLKKNIVFFRGLTSISEDQVGVVKGIYNEVFSGKSKLEIRHLTKEVAVYHRFVIQDSQET